MNVRRLMAGVISAFLSACTLSACGGGAGGAAPAPAGVQTQQQQQQRVSVQDAAVINRSGFVGAFYRAEGPPPYGIFAATDSQTAPSPYPTPGGAMLGSAGYCDHIAANGASIDGSYGVDATKLTNLIYAGARWSRMPVSQFFADLSHVFGSGTYAWGTIDAAQCISYLYHNIRPVIGLEAGPVQYNATPGVFSPVSVPTYESAGDFGTWCGAVAAHEKAVFPGVTQFSLPGNEVNTDPGLFPGGLPQIAAYSKACYAAVKAANPNAYVYGFELNMSASVNAQAFVSQMAALGCKPGTCYDGIAMHLTLAYPVPPATTPCYPAAGGAYSMQCVNAVQQASGLPVHILISETVYPVPGMVPDEQTKASAIVAAYTAFAANSSVDGVAYANVDECALYPSGYFFDGCLISQTGTDLPGFYALQYLAGQHFL